MFLSGPRGNLVSSNVVLTASTAATAVALGLLARRSVESSESGGAAFAVELRRYPGELEDR